MERSLLVLAWIFGGLALLPIFGLIYILIDPPADPFGIPAPHIVDLLSSPIYFRLAQTTALLGVVVASASTALGALFAWAEARFDFFGKKGLLLMSLLPLAVPSYIMAATTGTVFESFQLPGILNQLNEGFAPAALSLILITTPYTQLTLSAALKSCSAAEEEASILLGATTLERIRLLVWPQIKAPLSFSFLISFLYAISDFGAVAALDLPVLTWRQYDAVRHQNLATAALLGSFLIAIALPPLILAQYASSQAPQKSVANPRTIATAMLDKKYSYPLYCLFFAFITIGLFLPLLQLLSWIWSGYTQDLEFVSPLVPLLDSFKLAALGTIMTLILSFPLAWSAQRTSLTIPFTQLSYLTSALPGVLVAFGLMSSALLVSQYIGGYALLLSSGSLLFLGYGMRFLAECFGPLRTGVALLDKRHEDICATQNISKTYWLSKIAIPTMRPQLQAAALLVFLAILKELPITLLLGGATGSKPLAFRIWDRYNEALWHDAGLSGLILLMLALTISCFILKERI